MSRRFLIFLLCLAAPVVTSASEFSFADTQGRTHSLEAHRGKWVLVNLWATWCAPCLLEMPELEALHHARKDLAVLGLAVDGQNRHRVVQFARKLGVTYPVIAGSQELARPFSPRAFPTSILYNPAGRQVLYKEGVVTREEIERVLSTERSMVKATAR